MKDASRSVPVVAQLLSDEQRPQLMADVKADYDSLRARHAAKGTERPLVTIEKARDDAHPDRLEQLPAAGPAPGGRPGEGAAESAVRQHQPYGRPVRPDLHATTRSPSCGTTSTGARSSTPGR